MANAAALIRESIWRDRDFRRLTRNAQCTYLQLVSQKDLDCAGLLTLHISLLAKGCDEVTQESILADLLALEEARFVFFDQDTDELFVRSYMRTAGVVKSPNIFKSALKSAGMVESPKLRVEVAAELLRLHRKEAADLADVLNPSGTLRPDPTNPSGTRTLSEPSSTGTVTGTGGSSVVGHSGEGAAPPRYCPKHPSGTDKACWACKSYREALEAWENQSLDAEEQAKSLQNEARVAAIKACNRCDEYGRIEVNEDGALARCAHQEAVNA